MHLAPLDPVALRPAFVEDARLRLPTALAEDDAKRLGDAVRGLTFQKTLADSAGTARLDPAQIAAMPVEQQQELTHRLMQAAARGQGFHYDGVVLGPDSPAPFDDFWTFLQSEQTLSFIRELTGETVTGADAQATRYGPGQYLTRHRDQVPGENRLIAYVLNLTEKWHPDWGGLLQFYEQDGTPRDAWAPGWNSLSLFHTRHIHAVTYVTPFAPVPRLSITGWFYG